MRKYLSTGLFGTILGLAVGTPADASLVSRGFLDEALENYATTTALDLKANQSDFTDLSNKIGDAWPYTFHMLPGLFQTSWNRYPQEVTIQNASDLLWFLFGGAQVGVLNLLGQSVVVTGAYSIDTGQIDDGFRSLLQLTDGWTDSEKKTYLGVKGLNDKIGTLPDGYTTVGAALTAIKGIAEDAKATALSAIPDPKAEGSTGKFVLTVDIVGDNATYRWEKIDRESETTTITNE